MAANYITAAELASYAYDVDTTEFDAPTLSGVISRASRMVDRLCSVNGFDFALETNERNRAAISSLGELFINVKRRPIWNYNGPTPGVNAIRLVKGRFSVSLQLTDTANNPLYQITYPGNTLRYPSAYLAGAGTLMLGGSAQLMTLKGADVYYEIDYQAGYMTIPDDLKEATTLIVRDILKTRYNPMGAESFGQGSMHVAFGTTGISLLMDQARMILEQGNYVRHTVV